MLKNAVVLAEPVKSAATGDEGVGELARSSIGSGQEESFRVSIRIRKSLIVRHAALRRLGARDRIGVLGLPRRCASGCHRCHASNIRHIIAPTFLSVLPQNSIVSSEHPGKCRITSPAFAKYRPIFNPTTLR